MYRVVCGRRARCAKSTSCTGTVSSVAAQSRAQFRVMPCATDAPRRTRAVSSPPPHPTSSLRHQWSSDIPMVHSMVVWYTCSSRATPSDHASSIFRVVACGLPGAGTKLRGAPKDSKRSTALSKAHASPDGSAHQGPSLMDRLIKAAP